MRQPSEPEGLEVALKALLLRHAALKPEWPYQSCSFDAALKPEGLDMAVKSCGLAAALKKIVWKQP